LEENPIISDVFCRKMDVQKEENLGIVHEIFNEIAIGQQFNQEKFVFADDEITPEKNEVENFDKKLSNQLNGNKISEDQNEEKNNDELQDKKSEKQNEEIKEEIKEEIQEARIPMNIIYQKEG